MRQSDRTSQQPCHGQSAFIESLDSSEEDGAEGSLGVTRSRYGDTNLPLATTQTLEPCTSDIDAPPIEPRTQNHASSTGQDLTEDISATKEELERLQRDLESERRVSEEYKLLCEELSRELTEVEGNYHNAALERDTFQAKYNEILSERFNRRVTGLWIPQAKIKKSFHNLRLRLIDWCDSIAHEAVKHTASQEYNLKFTEVFSVPGSVAWKLPPSTLTWVLLSQIFLEIVSRVFPSDDHNNDDDDKHIRVTDLWTSDDKATWIAETTDRLNVQGVPTEDIRLWLCLTTTALAPDVPPTDSRVEALVDSVWRKSSSLLQLTPDQEDTEAYHKLKQQLRCQIVPDAVKLSRLMRKCQSSICVRWPPGSRGFMSTTTPQSDVDDTCHSHLVLTTPELVTWSLRDGSMQETVLVASDSKHYTTERGGDGSVVLQESVH